MNILSENQTYSGNVIATIGFFDGVHTGHQYVLDQLKRESLKYHLEPMVVTFLNHPMRFFNPENPFFLLNTPQEKLSRLSSHGIELCLNLHFDKELSKLTSLEFLTVLARRYGVKRLLVGYDHHFGSDRKATFLQYQQYGKEVGIEIEQLHSLSNHNLTVSSSKIRKLLLQGDVELATEMLGYHYSLEGEVTTGHQIGRTIGFPTANLRVDPDKLIPKKGVYLVEVGYGDGRYVGLVNIGNRPTVSGEDTTIEVHILAFDQAIYGETLTLSFIRFLRDEQKFNSLVELKAQLEHDLKVAQQSIV